MWLIIEKTNQVINLHHFIYAYEIVESNCYTHTSGSVGDTRLVFMGNNDMDIPVKYSEFQDKLKTQVKGRENLIIIR